MMPSRVWEFLLGGLAFLYSRELRSAFKSIRIPITACMLGILFLSVIFFDIGHAWPSPMIVIPVVATMIILALDTQFSWYKIPAIQFLGKYLIRSIYGIGPYMCYIKNTNFDAISLLDCSCPIFIIYVCDNIILFSGKT